MKTKTILETRTINEKTIYICDFCGATSEHEFAIKQCERRHVQEKCDHSKYNDFRYSCDIDYDSTLITIYKHCAECGKLISETDIDSDDFSEEMLKQLMDKNENA